MAHQTRRFGAIKTMQIPVRMKFKTKSGQTVYFKAFKVVEKKKVGRPPKVLNSLPVETTQKPVRIKLRLNTGETIFVKAYKIVEKKKPIRPRTKKT